MAHTKGNSGNQVVQTVLIVFVSMLLAALVALLIGRNKSGSIDPLTAGNKESASENAFSRANGETDRDIAIRLSQDAAELVKSLELKDRALLDAVNSQESAVKAREGMADQMSAYNQKIKELEQKAFEHSDMLNRLNAMTLTNEKLEQLNNDYVVELRQLRASDKSGELLVANTRLETEVAELRAELDVNAERLQKLRSANAGSKKNQATLIAYREENNDLKKKLADLQSKLSRTQLFVKEANSLNPRAAALVKALTELNGISGPMLDAAYNTLQSRLSVRKLRHVKFAEGSAYVSDLEAGMIEKDLEEAGGDSFLLIVGYASTVGDKASNYELSAKRATAAAAVSFDVKSEKQDVKAVYLGQTDRFGPDTPTDNQVCEIWEIMPL